MAFGRQLHQAEGPFRTPLCKVRFRQSTVREFRTPQIKVRNWNSNVRNVKMDSSCVVVVNPACEVDFATCELKSQRAKVNSKLKNQLAKFSHVTMQRAKIGYFCRLFFF